VSKHHCSKYLHETISGVPRYCLCRGTVLEDGKWWCKRHCPTKRKVDSEAKQRAWKKKYEIEAARTLRMTKQRALGIAFLRDLKKLHNSEKTQETEQKIKILMKIAEIGEKIMKNGLK
jgi:hypothetical protein